MRLSGIAVAILVGMLAGASLASDTRTFIYDAQGRLIAVTRTPGNGGAWVTYSYDGADNRLTRERTTVPTRAVNSELSSNGTDKLVAAGQMVNGPTALVLQADGNLVLYQNGVCRWASHTVSAQAMYLQMQPDGRFAIFSPSNTAAWSSASVPTPASAGAKLVVENNGTMTIRSTSNAVLWTSPVGC